jgi:arginase
LAVKIIRQPKNIALLGAPTSAASLAAGHERGPQALRAAGLLARLTAAGFAVRDYGDCTVRVSASDEEHPRARNVDQARATVEELRPKIEVALRSGALPLVLGGDDTIVLGTLAGCRRYYRNVSLVDLDRDAGLNVPASTPSGCVDGMVLSHVIGRGAPELVRFWGEPPLVREPGVTLFGVGRLDEPEEHFLLDSSLRRYLAADIQSKGATAAAQEALERVHGHEFVLHIDLDVIASEDRLRRFLRYKPFRAGRFAVRRSPAGAGCFCSPPGTGRDRSVRLQSGS